MDGERTDPLRDDSPQPAAAPAFFPVSIPKLVVMSVCTLGIYSVFYWHYKNWRLLSDRPGYYAIRPFWRAVFSPLFCYELFQAIEETSQEHGVPARFDPGAMAFIYIVLTVQVSLLGFDFAPPLISQVGWLLAFIPVALVQRRVNELNGRVAPNADPNRRFTVASIGAIAATAAVVATPFVLWNVTGFQARFEEATRQARLVAEQFLEQQRQDDSTPPLASFANVELTDSCTVCVAEPEDFLAAIMDTLGALTSYEFGGAAWYTNRGGDYIRLEYETTHAALSVGRVYQAFVLRRPSESEPVVVEVAEAVHVLSGDSIGFYAVWGRSTCMALESDDEYCPCAWTGWAGLRGCG
jgi:hypothetical protein